MPDASLFRDTINDHSGVMRKVPIDFSKGGVGMTKWTAHLNFPVCAYSIEVLLIFKHIHAYDGKMVKNQRRHTAFVVVVFNLLQRTKNIK